MDETTLEIDNTSTTVNGKESNIEDTSAQQLKEFKMKESKVPLASQGVIPLVNNESGINLAGKVLELATLQYNMNISDVDLHLHIINDKKTDDIFGYSVDYFRSVGLGTSSDKGLLFVAVTGDEEITIQVITGYGLEGDLNDGKIGRFLDNRSLIIKNEGAASIIDYVYSVTSDLCSEISGAVCSTYQAQSFASSIGNGTTGGAGVARTYAVVATDDDCKPCERLNRLESNVNGLVNRIVNLENSSGGSGGSSEQFDAIRELLYQTRDKHNMTQFWQEFFYQDLSRMINGLTDTMSNVDQNINEVLNKPDVDLSILDDILAAITKFDIKIPEYDLTVLDKILKSILDIEIPKYDLTVLDKILKSITDIEIPIYDLNVLEDILTAITDFEIPVYDFTVLDDILAEIIDFDIEIPEYDLKVLDNINDTLHSFYTSFDTTLMDRLKEIVTAINDKELVVNFDKIINDKGTNFWDFLGGFFDRIFDFLDGLIDTIIHLIVPEDSGFLAENIATMSSAFNSKIEPVTRLKNEVTNVVQVEQKEFKDIRVDLPLYGNVTLVKMDYIKEAVPTFRNIVSGFMILITAIWAYRKVTSGVIK